MERVFVEGTIISVNNIGNIEVWIEHGGSEELNEAIVVNVNDLGENDLMLPVCDNSKLLGKTCFLAGTALSDTDGITRLSFCDAHDNFFEIRLKSNDIPTPDYITKTLNDESVFVDIEITGNDIRRLTGMETDSYLLGKLENESAASLIKNAVDSVICNIANAAKDESCPHP